MTIRFAAARPGPSAVLSRNACAAVPLFPANDNGPAVVSDPVVIEALRHFARHGLCAAQRARDNAVAAHRSGDLAGYDWWLCVCRTLDRRMADALVNRTALHS